MQLRPTGHYSWPCATQRRSMTASPVPIAAVPTQLLDVLGVTKGASRGFAVLLLGGLLQPLVGTLSPTVGYYWLVAVAVVAFVGAAVLATPRGSHNSWINGSCAAVASSLLILPVVFTAGCSPGCLGSARIAVRGWRSKPS